ncbi:MAG: hypothetical protein Q8S31_06830 [Alphaproteobacteria bacterium]|nr:hypothetical protein [Alphaproteobacteria bacterium]
MKKNTTLALLLLNLTSFSAFSADNESDNMIIDAPAPNPMHARIINQVKIVFEKELNKINTSDKERLELIDIAIQIACKENWDYFRIASFQTKIFNLKLNIVDLKNIIELTFELLRSTSSQPLDYENLAKVILKTDLLNNNDNLELLKNILKDTHIDLKSGLTPFIEIICDTNDEGRKNLLDWQKNIFTLLPCEHINAKEFTKIFQYVANNPSQTPSEHRISFLKLLGQKELTHSINDTLMNVLINSSEADLKAAIPLLEKVFALYPSWTLKDCLNISDYILDRAMSSEFIERLNYTYGILGDNNWEMGDFKNCLNYIYMLSEENFNKFNGIFTHFKPIAKKKVIERFNDPLTNKNSFGFVFNEKIYSFNTINEYLEFISIISKINIEKMNYFFIFLHQKKFELKDMIQFITRISLIKDDHQQSEIIKFLDEKNWSPENSIKLITHLSLLINSRDLNEVFQFLNEKGWDGDSSISFLSSITLFKSYVEKRDFLQFSEENKFDCDELNAFCTILGSINDTTHLIKSLRIFMNNNECNKDNLIDIIHSLSAFNPMDRIPVAEKFIGFDASVSKSFANILKILFFMPSEYHERFINHIKAELIQNPHKYETLPNEIIFAILKAHYNDNSKNHKENWHRHWHETLHCYNKEYVSILANFINENKKDIHFDEDDTKLVTTILKILDYPKNSYKNHEKLLNKRKNFVRVSNDTPFTDHVDGYDIMLNPLFFETLSRKLSIDPRSVPYVSPNILLTMIHEIEECMRDKEFKNEVLGLISNFKNLKHNITSYDSYLITLLKTPVEHVIGAQFKCIMDHILSLSKVRNPHQLSEQQAAFLKTMASIFACSVGKDAGVINAHTSLPVESKLQFSNIKNNDYVESSSHRNALDFIYTALQENIDQLFYNDELLYFICESSLLARQLGDDALVQPVHQSLYLRNLIGDLVGSRYDVKFDIYYFEHNASHYFLNLTRQKAIDAFYTHAKPKDMIKFVQNKINEALEYEFPKNVAPSSQQSHHIYNGITQILEGTLTAEEIWDFDDDYRPLSIKDKAIFELLTKINAIKRLGEAMNDDIIMDEDTNIIILDTRN